MPLLIWRQESEMTPIDVQNSSLIETKINSWQELEKNYFDVSSFNFVAP